MATIATLRDNTRRDLKIDPGKDIWGDDELIGYLNEGINLVYNAMNFKFEWEDGTISPLVLDTAEYTKPTDYRRMLWAKIVDTDAASTEADKQEITIITNTLAEFQKSHDMDATGDQPGYIYEEGGNLMLYPIPNATAVDRWTIKYKYSEYPEVLISTDTPVFAASWHYILEWYAKYRAWDKLPGKENQAQLALQTWNLWFAKAIADMAWRQDDSMKYEESILPKKRSK